MAIKARSGTIKGSFYASGLLMNVERPLWSHSLDVSTSVNPGANNAFQSNHYEASGSILSNLKPNSLLFEGTPSGFYSITGGHMSVPAVSNSDFERTLAITNPANPIINIPNFIWELRDIPDLIRNGYKAARAIKKAGGSIPKHLRNLTDPKAAAAVHIGWEFGVRPLWEDLLKISRLQSSIEKRRKMFERLERRGLRCKVELDDWSDTSVSANYPIHSVRQVLRVDIYVSRKVTRWGSVRWNLTSSASVPRSDGEILRRITGFNADNVPLAVWESLPWSWLVDWFISVDSKLKAMNRVLATPSHCCVMTKSEITLAHPTTHYSGIWVVSAGKKRIWRHSRSPQVPPLPFSMSMPIFTGKQLSILASLNVLRSKY